jgi:hypothetical protein
MAARFFLLEAIKHKGGHHLVRGQMTDDRSQKTDDEGKKLRGPAK